MGRTRSFVAIALLIVALSAAAHAQAPAASGPPPTPPAAARPMDHGNLRRHIYTMEGALARAVSFGASRLNREIRTAMPEVMALSGEPQARGVYLEGYGIYFDVSVPVLNQVMMWSLRTMMGPNDSVLAAVQQLKQVAQVEKNQGTRSKIESSIALLESQLGPSLNPNTNQDTVPPIRQAPGAVGAAILADPAATSSPAVPEATPPAPRLDKKYFQDPNAINRAYTEAVQNALIDTMLDYAMPTAIKPHEFLTVAARDNMQRDTLAPPDPYEEVVTVLLQLKGSDIAAFRVGQIDAAEVRRRIQIKEF